MELFLTIAVLIFLFYIGGREQDKKARKQERYQKAFRITKYFGETEIALFRFLGKKREQQTCVWVLIKFNSAFNDASLLLNHWKYYIVDKWEGNDEKEKNHIEKEVRELLYLLPYEAPIIDTNINFDEYARIAEKKKWEQWEQWGRNSCDG